MRTDNTNSSAKNKISIQFQPRWYQVRDSIIEFQDGNEVPFDITSQDFAFFALLFWQFTYQTGVIFDHSQGSTSIRIFEQHEVKSQEMSTWNIRISDKITLGWTETYQWGLLYSLRIQDTAAVIHHTVRNGCTQRIPAYQRCISKCIYRNERRM